MDSARALKGQVNIDVKPVPEKPLVISPMVKRCGAGTVTLEANGDSTPNEELDIKKDPKISRYGVYTGKLFHGKYMSARSAGNDLAGLNAATSKNFLGSYMTKEGFFRRAGGLHNISGGSAPYYGEIPYTGRMIDRG